MRIAERTTESYEKYRTERKKHKIVIQKAKQHPWR